MVLLVPLSQGQADTIRQQAQNLEKQGRWFEACGLYDELLSKDRNHTELREAYRRCLRHFRQERRLQDQTLQSVLNKLTPSEASDLYDQIFGIVVDNYADREKVDLTTLFQQGIQELRAATRKKAFQQRHAGRASEADLSAFRDALDEFAGEPITSPLQANRLLRKILVAGSQFGLSSGVIALECGCGAANSLDEYSLYLAPGRLSQARAAQKNKMVGIGVEVALVGQSLEVARAYRKSPAAEAGLLKGVRITRIDGHWVDPLAPDIAAERLLGKAGTIVELEIIPRGQTMGQMVQLKRQAVLPSSVDAHLRGEKGTYIGYMQIHNFQESTLQEVKDVLAQWQGMPLRGIIMDLRGNPGGLLKSSLNVAELFLPESVIAHTISPFPDLVKTYRSHNVAPCLLPLVVLVDGETASAAEVLAGALKENQRAILIGQPTYGKSSIQCIIPLERAPGGLRLTVARFTSPMRTPFSGKGILPNFAESDAELLLQRAEELILNAMMMQ
jgi:carboxyl-terminal processing protease